MEPTIQINPLQTKVQGFRDAARNILRMVKINNLLQDKFSISRDRDYNAENLKHAEKDLARSNYRLSKLDKADPDYEDKLKEEQQYKKTAETQLGDLKNSNARKEVYLVEREVKIDESIAKWETGENKVSIDEVDCLTDQMIRKI